MEKSNEKKTTAVGVNIFEGDENGSHHKGGFTDPVESFDEQPGEVEKEGDPWDFNSADNVDEGDGDEEVDVVVYE